MSEIEDLRRDVIELRDWKEAVLGKCQASSGWNDLKWGGYKDGWGFVHYFIGHLNTRALEAEADLATPTVAQAVREPVGWMARSSIGGRLFAYTELTARLEAELLYSQHGFTVEPIYTASPVPSAHREAGE